MSSRFDGEVADLLNRVAAAAEIEIKAGFGSRPI
jgi:hypothetical protein